MLSKFLAHTAVGCLFLATTANYLPGQQPQSPSQQFEPVRQVPPSVHVPQGAVRNLRAPNMNSYASSPATNSGNATTINFSDSPGAALSQAELPVNGDLQSIDQQVLKGESPASGRNRMQEIPAVLQSANGNWSRNSPLENFEQNPQTAQSLRPPMSVNSNQTENRIVVDSQAFANDGRDVENQLNELRQLQTVQQVAYLQHAEQGSPAAIPSAQSAAADENAFAPQQLEQRNGLGTGTRDSGINAVRQVSVESETVSGATVSLATPGIQVLAFGPGSIGINKVATYKVTVTNDSDLGAETIRIGIDIPESIELQNINVTTGHHEITNGVDQHRLVWTVDQLAARSTQTIAINAIPRTAEPFEMGVEWSFAPQVGTTHVQVTQPRLEMKISGPTELLFGEKAIYDVTISNPGTGQAEQVSVALPEALGGERTMIGDIPAGGERRFNVELLARTAGELLLAATAFGDGDIKATANHDILVRRANLNISMAGPTLKYAGSQSRYTVTIANDGDATAAEVMAVMALPTGVRYLNGVNDAQTSDGGLKWNVGTITAGDRKTFDLNCQLDAAGSLLFQAGARGSGDLAATCECQTQVDTIADLVLSVEDPQGPLPTGENVSYKLHVKNRGTRTANGVVVVMQFSEGIEPTKADGFKNKIATGQVVFEPISRIEPGQEIVLNVQASAIKSGNHVFRAQLTCDENDSREISEGTTRFFGDDNGLEGVQITVPADVNTADASEELKPETPDCT